MHFIWLDVASVILHSSSPMRTTTLIELLSNRDPVMVNTCPGLDIFVGSKFCTFGVSLSSNVNSHCVVSSLAHSLLKPFVFTDTCWPPIGRMPGVFNVHIMLK